MLQTFIEEIVQSEDYTPSGRLLWIGNGTLRQPDFFVTVKNEPEKKTTLLTTLHNFVMRNRLQWKIPAMNHPEAMNGSLRSAWTKPYYLCESKKWLLSYTKMVVSGVKDRSQRGEK